MHEARPGRRVFPTAGLMQQLSREELAGVEEAWLDASAHLEAVGNG